MKSSIIRKPFLQLSITIFLVAAANETKVNLAKAAEKPAPITLYAAASLEDILPKLAEGWMKRGHPKPNFNFEATSRLAKLVEDGAPADAFFSADEEWMDDLAKHQKIDPSTRIPVVTNSLVVIIPSSPSAVLSKVSFKDPKDLQTKELKHFALAGENVPVSKYFKAALDKMGLWAMIEKKIVRGDNVRTSLKWVAEGEADAGAVYATDAAADKRVKTAFTFAADTYPKIIYPAAVVSSSSLKSEAEDFLKYCQSDEAKALFKQAGFGLP
jgi:molybdate transport system substrate-binding protein